MKTYKSIAEIKAAAKSSRYSQQWFSLDTMQFFGTKIETGVVKDCYFVTSDSIESDVFTRRFTVRHVDDDGNVSTVGEFRQYATLNEALASI